jgi:rubrerythrin
MGEAMKFMGHYIVLSILVGVMLCISSVQAKDSMTGTTNTLQNLQTAYQFEMLDHARYVAYAQKADAEGYKQVASMFRAMAEADNVHTALFADAIRKSGGTPNSTDDSPAVNSTKENLQIVAATESKEANVLYPQYSSQAQKDNNADAQRVLNYAIKADDEHAAIYTQAIKDLESYRGDNITFLVCPGCGKTVRSLKASACPVCGTPKDKFLKIQ